MDIKTELTTAWRPPVREGEFIVFKQALCHKGAWFDVRVLGTGRDKETNAESEAKIQQLIQEKILPNLPDLKRVAYERFPKEVCTETDGKVLEGMRELYNLFHSACEAPEGEILSDPDFLAKVDEVKIGPPFDAGITYTKLSNYAAKRGAEPSKDDPLEIAYQSYSKVVQNPNADGEDEMRRWLKALYDTSFDYLKHHPRIKADKILAAKILFNFISINASTKELINYLIRNEL